MFGVVRKATDIVHSCGSGFVREEYGGRADAGGQDREEQGLGLQTSCHGFLHSGKDLPPITPKFRCQGQKVQLASVFLPCSGGSAVSVRSIHSGTDLGK